VFKTQIEESLLRERLLAMLSGFFGLLAAVLATVGLYGVMSYTVERRRTEIGIRMALGAGRYAVIGMILREATLLLGIGLSIGTALALLCGFSASSMLFGLEAYDPPTLAMAMAGLAVVTTCGKLDAGAPSGAGGSDGSTARRIVHFRIRNIFEKSSLQARKAV
jgi:ABC-type antimicrobial peptide transport system permease subunit